jgi:hypothetical protein
MARQPAREVVLEHLGGDDEDRAVVALLGQDADGPHAVGRAPDPPGFQEGQRLRLAGA